MTINNPNEKLQYYKFLGAHIMHGHNEAFGSWVDANIEFANDDKTSASIIEMGGFSVQVITNPDTRMCSPLWGTNAGMKLITEAIPKECDNGFLTETIRQSVEKEDCWVIFDKENSQYLDKLIAKYLFPSEAIKEIINMGKARSTERRDSLHKNMAKWKLAANNTIAKMREGLGRPKFDVAKFTQTWKVLMDLAKDKAESNKLSSRNYKLVGAFLFLEAAIKPVTLTLTGEVITGADIDNGEEKTLTSLIEILDHRVKNPMFAPKFNNEPAAGATCKEKKYNRMNRYQFYFAKRLYKYLSKVYSIKHETTGGAKVKWPRGMAVLMPYNEQESTQVQKYGQLFPSGYESQNINKAALFTDCSCKKAKHDDTCVKKFVKIEESPLMHAMALASGAGVSVSVEYGK